jgi:hypothetical protein
MKTLLCLLVSAFALAPFTASAIDETYGEIRGNGCYFIEPTSIIPSADARFCPKNGLEQKVLNYLKANGLENDIYNNVATMQMDKGCRAIAYASQLTVTAYTTAGSMNEDRYYQFRIDTKIQCGEFFNEMPIYLSYFSGNGPGAGFFSLNKLF